MLERLLLYARTVRRLRPRQLAYLPLRRLQARLPARVPAAVDVAVPQERRAALAREVAAWPPRHPDFVARAYRVVRGRFDFLGHEEAFEAVDWSARHVSHLWSYHLHYFDYAEDLARAHEHAHDEKERDTYARAFERLALGWIEGARPGHSDGWEPYPISLRTVSWVKALLLFGPALDPGALARIEASLARQVAFLEGRLEWQVAANHLLENFVALFVAGLYFDGPAGSRWECLGRRGVGEELLEQVLPDGTHYERSPMYHAAVLANALELLRLLDAAGTPAPDAAVERVRRMVDAFAVLCRPDGSLHLFNDAAQGAAPRRAWLDAMAQRSLGAGVSAPKGHLLLPDAGYHGFADPSAGTRLLIDCGEPGPAYQPGHGHCDLLSFELDLSGAPFAVDSGLHGYEGDPFREYVRSTRAHNTVSVAGREQMEVWATFRMARRPRVEGAESGVVDGRFRFRGAYRPFHDPRCRHERTVEGWGGEWRVADRVQGAEGARLTSFLHLHPDWDVELRAEGAVAHSGERTVEVRVFAADRLDLVRGRRDLVQGWYCPEFGTALPAPVLEITVDANDGRAFGYEILAI